MYFLSDPYQADRRFSNYELSISEEVVSTQPKEEGSFCKIGLDNSLKIANR